MVWSTTKSIPAPPGWGIAGHVLAAYAAVGAGALLVGGPPFFVVAGVYLAALAPAFVL